MKIFVCEKLKFNLDANENKISNYSKHKTLKVEIVEYSELCVYGLPCAAVTNFE